MKLLLLDDSRDYHEYFATLCTEARLSAPVTALTIADAVGAIRSLRAEGEFFVCFVDIGLRDESGLDFMPRLEALGVEAPVAILSDTDEQAQVFLAAKRGAAAFFAKDRIYAGAQLIEAISQTIATHFEFVAEQLSVQGAITDTTAAMFGEFIHDVRDVFVPIQAAATEIAEASDDPFVVAEANEIIKLAGAGETYLDTIREFRETGFIQCQREALDISEAIRGVWHGTARKTDELVFEAGEGLTFDLDPRGVERIFTSLIKNVKVHVPQGAVVRVAIHRRSVRNHVYFNCLFGDDGPGIPRADWEKIFMPGGRSTSPNAGSGLGLAIARRWVDVHRMDGALASMRCAEGPGGVGAWFEINLPVETGQ